MKTATKERTERRKEGNYGRKVWGEDGSEGHEEGSEGRKEGRK